MSLEHCALAAALPERPRAGLTMPIHAPGGAEGVVCVLSVTERDFGSDEVDFLHAVANVLAEAIQRTRSEQELRHQALHDPLTRLPNRALFVDRLTLALAQARRRETTVGVLFLDLDHFKLVNDSLGHTIGDDLLRLLARRLDESLRPGDTVARFGGDEFVMICNDLDGTEEALAVADRLAMALRQPFAIGNIQHNVRASIGIATSAGPHRTAEDLIREADAAMYRAKDRGRDRHEVFDQAMRASVSERWQVANELPRAIEEGELRVVYQPIVNLENDRMWKAEALVRWDHPTRGSVSPADFIPVAEETGAILPIGEFVLGEACRAAVSWQQDGTQLGVAVNLSLHQVRQPGFPRTVARILADTGLDPSLLHLEITESVLMEEADTSMLCLKALKALGVVLVLDDFGTGYSSLAYVKRFPIDTLKIDRTFISDLDDPASDTTIVEAIVNMARGLRLRVIAEGVESDAQAEALRVLGCHSAQGWLFSRDVAEEEIPALCARRLPTAAAAA